MITLAVTCSVPAPDDRLAAIGKVKNRRFCQQLGRDNEIAPALTLQLRIQTLDPRIVRTQIGPR
jgi:hypothetical protein